MNLAMAERLLTPEQVAEGQRLAREFKPRKGLRADEAGSAAGKRGVVQVVAADEGCEILVDGAFVGNTPARVKLAEGAHVVEVKKAGFKDYRKEIKLTEGSELTLRVALDKR